MRPCSRWSIPFWCLLLTICSATRGGAAEMPWVVVSEDGTGFLLKPGGESFRPRGVNYDRDHGGRLLEDYWETEWKTVEEDFEEMKGLGANVVRVHLQFGKFLQDATTPNEAALTRLGDLVQLAERSGLYLDVTGLGCYHKRDVPEWYDALSEADRWSAQCRFWEAVATRCANSPAIFCYDLMNEPVVPGGRRKEGDWLGPAFGGKHFVQVISLDQAGRPRHEIARDWIEKLTGAIRGVDQRHLVTVGLVDWSLDRPGLTSGFVPEKVCGPLDFVAVHVYPETGKLDAAAATLKGFQIGKPVVVEETFPLKCSGQELLAFMERPDVDVQGWISFYWGKPVAELKASNTFPDALVAAWLELFPGGAK